MVLHADAACQAVGSQAAVCRRARTAGSRVVWAETAARRAIAAAALAADSAAAAAAVCSSQAATEPVTSPLPQRCRQRLELHPAS